MKQFFSIFKFEFSGYLKNRIFAGITVIIVLVIGGALSWPRISERFKNDGGDENQNKPIVLISDEFSADKERTLSLFEAWLPGKTVRLTDKTAEQLANDVNGGTCSCAVVVTGANKYTYIIKDVGLYDTLQISIDEIMTQKYRLDKIQETGLSYDDAAAILTAPVESEIIRTGVNQLTNFFYTYVLIFALYMAIMLYGQFVATGVASEKSSRAMELLITSAKPVNLMFGKIIGAGLAGLLQFVVIFGSSFLFFNLNESYWGGNEIINSIFKMPLQIMLFAVLFFILGFFIYAFLYGAIGSVVTKTEEINTAVLPITFLFIIAFLAVMFSIIGGNVNSDLMIVLSYIPFTSPMAMFVRISMSDVPVYEIIISVSVLVASTVGIGYVASKIYRVGVLLYGKAPSLPNLIKAVKNQNI